MVGESVPAAFCVGAGVVGPTVVGVSVAYEGEPVGVMVATMVGAGVVEPPTANVGAWVGFGVAAADGALVGAFTGASVGTVIGAGVSPETEGANDGGSEKAVHVKPSLLVAVTDW